MQVQVRENVYLTKGRVIVRGKLVFRGKAKFADYVLYAKPNANIPLAIVEAKDNNQGVGDGMQQGLGYADMLDVPFVFSSNGDGFLLHDRTGHAAKVEPGMRICMGQRMMLSRTFPDLIAPPYLVLALRDPAFQRRMIRAAVGSTVKHLRVGDVEGLAVPIPPFEEQRRIVAKVSHLMKLCDALEAELRRAEGRASKLLEAVVQEMVA